MTTTLAPRPDFGQALVPFDLQDDARRRGTQILRNFFAYLSNTYTRKAYAEDLRVFTQFMRGIYRERLSPAQVIDLFLFGGQQHGGRSNHAHGNACAECFRAWQLKLDRSTATINRRLTMLRGLTAAARRLGLLTWSLEVRSLRNEVRSDTRGPVTADVIRLLDHLTTINSPLTRRDTAIIRLMHDLGLRRGEVARFDMSSVDFQDNTIAVIGKGQREAVRLVLPTPTHDAIEAWLTVRGMTPGPLFLLAVPGRGSVRFRSAARMTGCAIYKQIRLYGRRLGLKLRPHGFRHTAITTAMISAGEHGIPFEEVMQFSRHRSIMTLMRYRDFLENRQPELAKAVADRLTKSPRQQSRTSPTTDNKHTAPTHTAGNGLQDGIDQGLRILAAHGISGPLSHEQIADIARTLPNALRQAGLTDDEIRWVQAALEYHIHQDGTLTAAGKRRAVNILRAVFGPKT